MKLYLLVISGFLTTGAYAQQVVNGLKQGEGPMTFPTGLTLQGNYVDGRFYTLSAALLKHVKRNTITLPVPSNIYVTDDADKSLHYYSLLPEGKIKGTFVLLPSSGETTESVLNNNKDLIAQCYSKNIIAIVLSINSDQGLDDDPFALKFLNTVFLDVVSKYKAPSDKFVMGGLSNGGMLSLRYTEMSRDSSKRTSIVPMAVYAADPPVDLADLYNTSVRKLKENEGRQNLDGGRMAGLNEAKMLVASLEMKTGGTPEKYPEKYNQRSMFARSLPNGGNAHFLFKVPVRIYCDPDILWQIKERDRNYYDMNAANLSALITFLNIHGSKQAAFVSSLGLGHRLDGRRHPHSWSIVQPDDCINWLEGLLND
nr:hypothetical protein [uncultured Mucilaginibacter sp.]